MGDIPDQLDGIIYDLLGIINTLQLSSDVLVYQVIIQVKAGCSQKGTSIVMKISRNMLPFFLLPPD